MEHVVFYPGPDAAPAFCRFASLEEAVRFVEHLRNTEGVAEVSVHALTPVPLAFRAYYRVEVPAGEAAPAFDNPFVESSVPEQAVLVEQVAEVPGDEVPTPEIDMPEMSMADLPVAEVPVPDLMGASAAADDVDGEAAAGGKRTLGFFAH